MKYLVSAIQLGRLLEADKEERERIVKSILDIYYVIGTDDQENLNDHIEIGQALAKFRGE